jgi:hypothetical protein
MSASRPGDDMRAAIGDWLVVKSPNEAHSARRAAILTVGKAGAPPYTVRWLDTGRTALYFPGPDAEVLSAERQAELDRERAERAARVQEHIAAHRSSVE